MVMQFRTGLGHIKDSGNLDDVIKVNEDAFAERGLKIVPNYFSLDRKDIAYALVQLNEAEKPIGGIIATWHTAMQEMQEAGLKDEYHVLDKIAVLPQYWRNGVLSKLMGTVKSLDSKLPTAWRTSDEKINETYKKHSQISKKIGSYWVHGINFGTNNGSNEINRPLFEMIAYEVAKAPATLIPINNKPTSTLGCIQVPYGR